MQKRFQEYFAKVVLEHCFPNRFNELIVSDKPDLRCGKEVGIEVTNCMPEEAAEAFNLWHRVAKQGEQTPPRILERLEQLKDTVHLVGDELVWEQDSYVDDDIDNSPIKKFVNAFENKVEWLNSANADYANMESYELFVNSALDIESYKLIYALLKRLTELNKRARKFDIVYLITINQKLLVFDIKNGTVQIKYLYSHLDRMADEAKEIYLGVKNDET